jgi:hypothetical protein
MKKRKQVPVVEPIFAEVIGNFDLLPKIAYKDLEVAVDDYPKFMYWGLYQVRTKSPKKIVAPFCVVDNLDPAGEVFVIKDMRVTEPIVINLGPTPAVISVAETLGIPWHHAGLQADRNAIGDTHEILERFCSSIELVVGIFPLQSLKIYVDHRVQTSDHVFIALSQAREAQEVRIKKRDKK